MNTRFGNRHPFARGRGDASSFARVLCAAVLLVAPLCLNACKSEEPAWVQKVESAHAQADSARDPEARERAHTALEDAYRAVPISDQRTAIWIKQDLAARLGEAALDSNRYDDALRWVDQGLALSDELNVARADLLRVRGEALEGLGRKDEAVSALHEALKVNQALMERALRGKTEQDHE